uniref:Myosin-binding protein H n=1 Tax=Ciona intestinalis TaxID=7719 RepID=F7AV37_CIOIN
MPVPGADPAKKILKKKVVKKVVKKRKESVAEKAPAKDVAPKAEEKPVPDGIVEAPENATTTEGVEVTVRVKVMHIDVLHAMKVIWIKGKWKELTKGDRYDMWCNERTGEHFLKFRQPKVSDGGSYKVKAVSPIGENEASFNVAVGLFNISTAPVVEEHKIEINDEKDVLKDVDFRNRLKKVYTLKSIRCSERLRKEESSGKFDIWSLLKTASTRDYESIAFKFGIPDMRIMLRRLSQMSKLANKKCPSFTKKLPESHSLNLGEKLVLEAEVANEQMTVKWLKNGNEITPGKGYQIVTKANKRYLMIDQTSKDDDATYTCVVGKDVTACEVFVQEPPVTIVKGLEDAQIACGETTEFCCEISNENGKFRFLKDGVDIPSNDRFKVKKEGVKVTLTITEAVIEDEGFYQFMTNGSSSCSELLVQEPAAVFTRAFSDLKVNFKETAEFFCEVSNETTKGNWLKDGKPMKADDRVKITETGKARKLVISGVKDSDQGEYTFAAEDNPTCSITAALEMTGGHITVERKKAPPKIFLDHSLKDRSIQVRAGNKIKLDIPISGEPAPVPEWKKGPKLLEEGSSKLRVRSDTAPNGKRTSLIIDKSKRTDSGEYTLILTSEEGFESATFTVKVIDVPSAPTVPKVSNVTAETCYAVWTGPSCNGGCEIKGYVMERKKTKSERWIRLNFDPLQGVEYEARRMIEGTEYQLRVRAVNEVGVGEPSPASIPFTPLAPCSEPSGFKVSAATDDSLELSWLPPADIGAAGLDGYLLEQQLVGEEDEKWTTVQSNGGLLPNNTSKILMDKLVTGKKYRFRLAAINKAGSSGFTEIGPVVCAAVVEEAKIVLPRHLLKPVKVKVGGKLHVNVPYQGRPKPQLTWSKEGKALEDHVAVRNSLDSSVLFIRTAERWDSGKYDLQLKVGDDVVGAKVEVAVIDIPSKPRQVKLVEVVGNSASLKWEEPNDSGNTEILGYIVEKRDARSDDWYVVYDKLRHKQCQVSDLVLGNNYFFRVRAFNEVGTGESNGTKDSANIPKEKTVYKKPDYAPMDFRMKPEFTQLLNGRRIVENYNGTLSCALKCNPRPKIKWFKNKIEIIDNPKYKMTQSMGIVQLEIRRARAGDAGNYTVTAINELGEASCSAEVTVKE